MVNAFYCQLIFHIYRFIDIL